MKRSEINSLIRHAEDFFEGHRFKLPPFAFWTPDDWLSKGHECDEIRHCGLGWDLTDFGAGNFMSLGLLLFTVRNGRPGNTSGKSYAEKIMLVREHQVTAMHFHWKKMEDIINRGGGRLVLELNQADPADERRFSEAPFEVSLDGVRKTCRPGEKVSLLPGESITFSQYQYHRFWAEDGCCMAGEVSQVNDDNCDNCFFEPCGRFLEIEEDVPPLRYLCNEYPEAS